MSFLDNPEHNSDMTDKTGVYVCVCVFLGGILSYNVDDNEDSVIMVGPVVTSNR